MGKAIHVTQAALDAAIDAGREYRARMPHATSVSYDPTARVYTLQMLAGGTVCFHADQVGAIAGATDAALADVELSPSGGAIGWPQLDMDISLVGLVMDVVAGDGWKTAMRQLLLGEAQRARTPAKAEAARLNGAKGGRPKKVATAG